MPSPIGLNCWLRHVPHAPTCLPCVCSCFDGPVPSDVKDAAVGCDMSHRGGPTSFVKLLQLPNSTVLRWADYVGEDMSGRGVRGIEVCTAADWVGKAHRLPSKAATRQNRACWTTGYQEQIMLCTLVRNTGSSFRPVDDG